MPAHDRHDPGRFTGGRTERPKDRRRLKAGFILARTAWLDDALVWWTGPRPGTPTPSGHNDPWITDFLPRIVEQHLRASAPGLYAVEVGLAGQDESPLAMDVRSITPIDEALLANTSRALTAGLRFPKAIGRKVGGLDTWHARATERVHAARRCLDAARDENAASALTLEAEAVWPGSGGLPSHALPIDALTTTVCEPSAPCSAARLAATILGMRRRATAVPSPLKPWSSLGLRLNSWSPSNVVHLGSVLGTDSALALVAAAPWLNDRAHQATVEECRLARGVVDADATRDLLALVGRDHQPPSDIDTHLRALNLALRLRTLGVLADPRILERWIAIVGWGNAVVQPSGQGPAVRWCADLHRSLSVFMDRLEAEHATLDPERAGPFREWIRRAAPLGPDAVETLLACRPWRAAQPWWPEEAAIAMASQRVVEGAARWLHDLGPSLWRHLPDANRFAQPSNDGLLLPYSTLALADVKARDAVLAVGTRLARDGTLRWNTLVDLLDALALNVEWWRLSASLARDRGDGWVGRVAELLARTHTRESDAIDTTAIDASEFLMTWCGHGFAADRRLLAMLASREGAELRGLIQSSDDDTRELALRVSGGDARRLRNTLVLGQRPRRHAWPLLPAWALLDGHAQLQAGMRSCFDRPELVARAARMLDRLALARRLSPGSSLRRRLAALAAATADVETEVPLAPDALAMLRRIAGLAAEAPLADPVPRPLQKILDSPGAMASELRALRHRAKSQVATERQRARLTALERLLDAPGAAPEQIGRQLKRAMPKHFALTTLAALEKVAGSEIGAHWARVLGVPAGDVPETANWDNALGMVKTVRHNRRPLRELLRHEIRGDRGWIRDLPANRSFLSAITERGLNAEAWLAARSRRLSTPAGALSVYVADDPLEVLQMGNLFGTCLSADGTNAHAAIAAAVEVNKRVLYLRDAHDRVHGRRLLALTLEGEVIGFHSYGSGEAAEQPVEPAARTATGHERAAPSDVRPWVKLAFDLVALDLARAASARLRWPADDSMASAYLTEQEERALELFCQGYFDRIEPFDWWIAGLSEVGGHTPREDRSLVSGWLTVFPREPLPPGPRSPSACARALLWLGPHAPPLTEERSIALGLGTAELSVLARHSASPRLRREARELAGAHGEPASHSNSDPAGP